MEMMKVVSHRRQPADFCSIDVQAHQGARRLIVAGLALGTTYWIAVVRMSELQPLVVISSWTGRIRVDS
jgi:hypothetical protein